VRAHADDPSVADDLFDRHLREWVALADGPLVDLCLFLEEAGAALLPGKFFATSVLFAPLMASLERAEFDEALAGSKTGTVAMADAAGYWTGDGQERTFVMEADRVDQIALVQRQPDGSALVGLVAPGDLELRFVETMDTTRRVFNLEAGTLEADSASTIESAPLERLVARGTVAAAAELIGVSRWLLDTTVAYVGERVQFGRPIGSFQGLQFEVVDMALDHERAVAAVYFAAMSLDADDPGWRQAVHVAKAAAGTAARHGARVGMQAHGGIGYTWEHDLHLYLRRAYAGDDLFGDAAWHHDRLGDLIFDQG
jgi:hypothetical protein